VEVRSGPHRALAWIDGMGRPLRVCEELRAHAFCERPLYRPGETVRGRIFVRRIESYAGKPHGEPVRGESCTLRLWPREKDEQRLQGTLNAHGVLTFETRIPRTAAHGRVDAELTVGGEKVELRDLFRVDPFRRSPILVDLNAPDRLRPCEKASAELRARWSNGAAAVAAPVRVQAWICGLTQEIETRLGQNGTLRIDLPRDEAFFAGQDRDLKLEAVVRGPDGQGVTRTCWIRLPEIPEQEDDRPRFVGLKERARPGDAVRFRLRYKPDVRGLCVLWTRDHVEARAVRFDVGGIAEQAFTIPSDARGLARIEFTGAGRRLGRSVRLAAPKNELNIALETGARKYEPGSRCRVAFRVTDGAGRPVPALLCASLVDERILALEDVDDRVAANRFGRLQWSWQSHEASDWPVARPWRLIGEMLADGRPRKLVKTTAYHGPCGCPTPTVLAALGISEELLRKRFRPSAGFRACLPTDQDGRASYDIELPDDLTTWRLRVVAVDKALGQGAARFTLVTEKPLSVEAALPRFLRLGDRIRTTPVVSGPTATPSAWAAGVSQKLALEHRARLAAGLELHARGLGRARFEVGVRAGEHSDALQRVLPVERDTVREERKVTATVTEAWSSITLPDADELDSLVIGVGRAALLADLREELAGYPYRCAEQTSSRLLGLFGRKVPKQTGPALDAEAMFARLIRLWRPQSLLYAWWPADPGDPGITALVLHTLCELKAAGHPLARYGLAVSASNPKLEAIAHAVSARKDEPDSDAVARVEHAIALLRIAPENKALFEAVQAFLSGHAGLPRGLMCRAGLALTQAGQRDRALEIARAMRGPWQTRFPGLRLGERNRVQLAFELRLRQVLGLADARTRYIEEQLLRHIESHGFENTWSAACALHALDRGAASEPRSAANPVEVRIDGTLHTLVLDEKGQYRTRLELEGKPKVQVRSPSGAELRARLVGARHLAAKTYAARGEGLGVTRSISGAAPPSALRRGRVYRLAIEVAAERPARYLVVRCPLPAGCEVQGRPAGSERHDDAVVATLRYIDPKKPRRIEIPVVFGFEGSMLWPPVHVFDMYGPSPFAYSSGSRLRVVPDERSHVGDRPGVAVLSRAWREANIEALLEKALHDKDPDKVRSRLREISALRLPLTRAQCRNWLEPLFVRHKDDYWFLEALFELPLVPDELAEPATAYEFARTLRRGAGDLALRRKLLEAPDATFECLLGELARDTINEIEDLIDKVCRIGSIRHEIVTECPEALSAEVAFAEAVFARAERSTVAWDESAINSLESLSEIDASEALGAAEGPVEAGIRQRLARLKKRAAVLRARHVRPEVLTAKEKLENDIEERRWREVPRAHWPEELSRLYRSDVEAFAALGEDGIRYMIAQVNASADIDDEAHWLETLASGPEVDLAVLKPLLEEWRRTDSEYIYPEDRLRRVPTEQLVSACRRDPLPYYRVLCLRELARRGETFPLRATHPAEIPYHVYWQCLHKVPSSRDALKAVLFAGDTPEAFPSAAWTALLPDPGYSVFKWMVGEMTEREHLDSFTHLTPEERRSSLDEVGIEAVPARLTDAVLRELHGELWARILADEDDCEYLLGRFLQSAYGFQLLGEHLASAHKGNHEIAYTLLVNHGISLSYRTAYGWLLQLDAGDQETRERLAMEWLDGDLGFPVRHVPHDALIRILRRRGCSLR